MPEYLTISKIAQRLGISERRADYAARTRGITPNVEVPGVMRMWRVERLEDFENAIHEISAKPARERLEVSHG